MHFDVLLSFFLFPPLHVEIQEIQEISMNATIMLILL